MLVDCGFAGTSVRMLHSAFGMSFTAAAAGSLAPCEPLAAPSGSVAVKQEGPVYDDLANFDAHSWAMNHVKVEVKDETPELLPDMWRFVGEKPDPNLQPQLKHMGKCACAPHSYSPRTDQVTNASCSVTTFAAHMGEGEREPVPHHGAASNVQGAAGMADDTTYKKESNELWVTVVTNQEQSSKKMFKCKVCSKCFSTKGNLNNHMRSHSGEKPFMCNICGRQFSFNCNLNTHIRTHTGVKPFKCEVCGKSFITKGNLRIHSRTHTGEKPYQCSYCGRGFTVNDNLSRHLKTHNVVT